MKREIRTQSISRTARSMIAGAEKDSWRVQACFATACNLVNPAGQVLALVTEKVGDGPLNLVLQSNNLPASDLPTGQPARFGKKIELGSLVIDYRQARTWEPQPDWHALRARVTLARERLTALWQPALARPPASIPDLLSLVANWEGRLHGNQLPETQIAYAARPAADLLRGGWSGDFEKLARGAAQLAGLGPGLTPAGDDFMMGAMLWAWLAHPVPRLFGYALSGVATPRTTTLSAAWLQLAAKGECSQAWHHLLAALTGAGDLARAVDQVVDYGATSGRDMLAGFLWLAGS